MKVATRFVAADGKEFDDSDKCLEYEALCKEIVALTAPWPEVKITGAAHIQQDRDAILRIQRSMVDIFERLHWKDDHTVWARIVDIPAGTSLIGRYVDDAGLAPERHVWNRIARLDNCFREYEQPYYAIQANKHITPNPPTAKQGE